MRAPPPALVLLYAALYGAYGFETPFLPSLLAERGLSLDLVGYALAAASLVRLVATPAGGWIADRTGARRITLAVAAVGAAGAGLALFATRDIALLFVVVSIQAALLAPVAPLTDALSVPAAREHGFDYARVRGVGSAAFIAATLLAGLCVDRFGLAIAIVVPAAIRIVAAVGALSAPDVAAASDRPRLRDIRAIADAPAFPQLLAVAALVIGSHALHEAFAVIRWRDAGVSDAMAGLLWSEAVASEVAVFLLVGPPLLRRLGIRRALVLSAGAASLRWTVAAATTSPLALALVQPLHGLTFALLHLACMAVIAASVPRTLSGSAQALYATALGLATALLTALAGPLYAALGGAAFLAMAATAAAAIPVAAGLALPSREGVNGDRLAADGASPMNGPPAAERGTEGTS